MASAMLTQSRRVKSFQFMVSDHLETPSGLRANAAKSQVPRSFWIISGYHGQVTERSLWSASLSLMVCRKVEDRVVPQPVFAGKKKKKKKIFWEKKNLGKMIVCVT